MEEIKLGYKQTDFGIIPQDWEIATIRDCLLLLTDFDANGSFADMSENVSTYDCENFAWYVRATDLEQNSKLSKVKYVDERSYKFLRKSSLFGGEVLIAKRGEIGKVYLFKKQTNYATLAPNLYLLKLNNKVSSIFLFFYLSSSVGNKLLKEINASTSLGALYKEDVKNLKITLPSLTEQTAIATALSDTDALIAALDKKIAKKQQIKQGAMQQLLTGKKRLPGFIGENKYKESEIGLIPEDWSVVNVSEAFKFLSNASFSRDELSNDGYVQCLHYGDIHTQYDEYIDFNTVTLPRVLSKKGLKYPLLQNGDIVMADASEDYAGLCKSIEIRNINEKKVIAGLHTIFLREKNNIYENGFKAYLFSISAVRRQLIEQSTGMKVFGVSKRNLEQIILPVPTKSEQTAIAQILTDMDNEIARLEKERDKYKEIKAGMMQVLLTGKVRLV